MARDSDAEKQQFNVYLPHELVRRLKHRAIDEGESLSRIVERIFEEYLARVEKKGRPI